MHPGWHADVVDSASRTSGKRGSYEGMYRKRVPASHLSTVVFYAEVPNKRHRAISHMNGSE